MEEAITFASDEERPIDSAQVRRLYETVDWGHGRSEHGIRAAIEASVALGAWDGDRLVGFVRALSDGAYRAYVEDVMVDPDYRGRRIGERMVAELLRALQDVEIVSLFCLPQRVAFYERNGFEAHKSQVVLHRGAAGVP